jgi:DNA-directed RNA polymerase specialized sigma24 family protein
MSLSAYDVALNKFDRLIWALAIRLGKGIEGMDVEDVVQEGRLKLFEILEHHGFKPEEEVAALFKRSLVNRIMDLRRAVKTEHQVVIDLEDMSNLVGDDNFTELFLKHYQEHLASMVTPEAALLLNQLLNPSHDVLLAFHAQTLRREHLQKQGFKVNVTHKLTHQLVGQVLGFSSSKTKRLISQLQDACVLHLGLRPWTPCTLLPTVA